MLLISHLQKNTTATRLLWTGWLLLIIGLFLPVINIPIPDPHMAPLLLFGSPMPGVDDSAAIANLTHAPIEGLRIAFLLIIKTVERARLSFEWGLLLILCIPVLLGVFAPVLMLVKSKTTHVVLALLFGLGLLGPSMMLILSADESIIGSGFYLWVLAILLLTTSRIKAFLS